MLNLRNAEARLGQAKKQDVTLRNGFNQWLKDGGIGIGCQRDPEFAVYSFYVMMGKEPTENLALTAGEVFNNLRTASTMLRSRST